MKQFFALAATFLLPLSLLQALNPVVDFAIFQQPDQSAYAEVYLFIPASDVRYLPNETGKLQAKTEVTLIFTTKGQIAQYDRYLLLSNELADSTSLKLNMLDLKRFPLLPGEYELEANFTDVNAPQNTALRKASFSIALPDASVVGASDVILVNSFEPQTNNSEYSKHGYNLVPNILGYYPGESSRLSFYTEIYNATKVLGAGTDFMCTYAVVNNRKMVVNNLRKFKKMKADVANVLLAELDISALPSGNYFLWVEVRDKKNEILTENAVVFQRNNPIAPDAESTPVADTNPDKLPDAVPAYLLPVSDEEATYYLQAIMPIATEVEYQFAQNAVNANNPDIIKRSLAAFWQQHEPVDPALAFSLYKEKVDYVEKTYKTFKLHGFETDRGRVFLKYGYPNDLVAVSNEPGALPYEIWHYYKLNNKQNNVKFVFYQPILASNDYELIHSDARGEVKDPRWQMRIYNTLKEQSNSNNLDSESIRNHFGGKASDFFNDN